MQAALNVIFAIRFPAHAPRKKVPKKKERYFHISAFTLHTISPGIKNLSHLVLARHSQCAALIKAALHFSRVSNAS